MGDSQDQGSVTEQLVELQGYARHRGMHDADDWIRVRRESTTGVDREQDLQDLRGMLGSRHIERCGGCDRYKFAVELCPHCAEHSIDTLFGRYALGAISTQSPAEVRPEVLLRWAEASMGKEAFHREFAEAIIDSGLDLVQIQAGRSDKDPYVLAVVRHDRFGVFDARAPAFSGSPWIQTVLDELVRRILVRFEELK